MLKIDLKKLIFFLALLITTDAFAINFEGKFVQGHFIIGKTEPESKVLIDKNPSKFAAIIIEPAGLVPTDIEFLKEVRTICNKEKIILIYDEIISGFRIDIGGAQSFFGIVPDLSCFGKGMANGYPLSAIVGKKEIMKLMEEIFFSTTFGGDTISLAAALSTIKKMEGLHTIEKTRIYGKKRINS